jgi:hypothetical protein
MVSAANYQENDGGVKVLRQKDETKNKKIDRQLSFSIIEHL